MTALKTLNEGEASFDEVLTFAFYTLSMKQRQGKEEETAEAHFLQAAHFMLQNASWDPYKQMMLKIILMEGSDAPENIIKIIKPLEEGYYRAFSRTFREQTGVEFWEEPVEEQVSAGDAEKAHQPPPARTRQYTLDLISVMCEIAKEAGEG